MDSSAVFNEGDYAWTLVSAALVFMMIPGVALFYSGLRSQQTSLSIVWVTLMAVSIVFIQWYLFGYSLVFSPFSKSNFIGDLSFANFRNTTGPDAFAGNTAMVNTPAYVYGLFQGMFAAFTAALIAGVVAERGRLIPFLVFILLWSTFVYDPIAYWAWNKNGWANKMGGLDWAGGTPVHICSGSSALAYTLMLKYNRLLAEDRNRNNNGIVNWTTHLFLSSSYRAMRSGQTDLERFPDREANLRPHNLMNALLGTMLVWFGWFGFNAGSELQANSRAASTFMASNLAACSGGIVFCLIEMTIRHERWSAFGFCTGAFAGLVAITPGAGWVPAWAGLIFGPAASIGCAIALLPGKLEKRLEEPLVIPVVHGLCGLIGMALTGIFADSNIALLDGQIIPGGWLNQHWIQLGWQLAGGLAGLAWSFGVSLAILILLQLLSVRFRFLRLRAREPEDYHLINHPIDLDTTELGGFNEAYDISSSNQNQPRPSSPRRTAAPRDAESLMDGNNPSAEPDSPDGTNLVSESSIQAQSPTNGGPLTNKRRNPRGMREIGREMEAHDPGEGTELWSLTADERNLSPHRGPSSELYRE